VIANLCDLARGNERADCDEASVPRRERWTQPQVTEEEVSGIVHNARSRSADILLNARRSFSRGGFIPREAQAMGS
jgi:hypothetical protein